MHSKLEGREQVTIARDDIVFYPQGGTGKKRWLLLTAAVREPVSIFVSRKHKKRKTQPEMGHEQKDMIKGFLLTQTSPIVHATGIPVIIP